MARAVLLLVTLLGLVGMHGLPDAMATPASSAAMSTSAAMPPALTVAVHRTGPSSQQAARRTDLVAHGHHVRLRGDSSRSIDVSMGSAGGCGMDHSNCVAVLRDPGYLAALSAPATVGAVLEPPTTAARLPLTTGPRAPREVSLIGLGISRT